MSQDAKHNPQGSRIEVPAPGKIFQWLARGLGLRMLVRIVNALANLEFRIDAKATIPSFVLSDTNAILVLPGSTVNGAAGGGGSGTVPFSGTGAPGAGTLAAGVTYLTGPVPSLYVDMTAKALYVCTTAGSNSMSVWAIISGGGGYMGDYDPTKAYSSGQSVRVLNVLTVAGVTVIPGFYVVPPGVTVPANGTANQIPQWPEPTSGTVYWHLHNFGINILSTCTGGTGGHVYGNASGSF